MSQRPEGQKESLNHASFAPEEIGKLFCRSWPVPWPCRHAARKEASARSYCRGEHESCECSCGTSGLFGGSRQLVVAWPMLKMATMAFFNGLLAIQGDVEAQYAVGVMYASGWGTDQDFAKGNALVSTCIRSGA